MKAGSPILCSHCGAVAFRTRREICDGDERSPETVCHPDGTPCQDGDPIQCPACGSRFSGAEIVDENHGRLISRY